MVVNNKKGIKLIENQPNKEGERKSESFLDFSFNFLGSIEIFFYSVFDFMNKPQDWNYNCG